jgi:hypothetical protein
MQAASAPGLFWRVVSSRTAGRLGVKDQSIFAHILITLAFVAIVAGGAATAVSLICRLFAAPIGQTSSSDPANSNSDAVLFPRGNVESAASECGVHIEEVA